MAETVAAVTSEELLTIGFVSGSFTSSLVHVAGFDELLELREQSQVEEALEGPLSIGGALLASRGWSDIEDQFASGFWRRWVSVVADPSLVIDIRVPSESGRLLHYGGVDGWFRHRQEADGGHYLMACDPGADALADDLVDAAKAAGEQERGATGMVGCVFRNGESFEASVVDMGNGLETAVSCTFEGVTQNVTVQELVDLVFRNLAQDTNAEVTS